MICPKADTYVAWTITGEGTYGRLAVRLEIADMPYLLFPLVHMFELKRVKTFPDRPKNS